MSWLRSTPDWTRNRRQSIIPEMPAALKSRLVVAFVASALCQGALGQSSDSAAVGPTTLPAPSARQVEFLKDIQPILTNSCYECHGPQKKKGALRLDQKTAALRGGDSGPLLVPGQSAQSLL